MQNADDAMKVNPAGVNRPECPKRDFIIYTAEVDTVSSGEEVSHCGSHAKTPGVVLFSSG